MPRYETIQSLVSYSNMPVLVYNKYNMYQNMQWQSYSYNKSQY